MKPSVIFSIIAVAAMLPLRGVTWDPRAPFESPEGIIPQIAAADHAVIYKSGQYLDVSTNVVFCDRNGKMLHELQVFRGRARLDGLDYSVDPITATTIGEMLRIQMENDSPGLLPGAPLSSR